MASLSSRPGCEHSSHGTCAVICISTNSVTTAPIVIARPVNPLEEERVAEEHEKDLLAPRRRGQRRQGARNHTDVAQTSAGAHAAAAKRRAR